MDQYDIRRLSWLPSFFEEHEEDDNLLGAIAG
jgi:hypothetical protein